MSGETVQVWRQPDGRWRWAWRAGETGDAADEPIVSAETFPSENAARESAEESYPDLFPRPDEEPQRSAALRALSLVVLVAAAVGRARGRGRH